uniref:Uncharacterized protein n=1 Tax=Amphimedon queenslandica TaxID=400682 RepID=A0A1X7UF92_AMPQE
MVSESTVRGIKRKYNEAFLQAASETEEEDSAQCTVTSLPKGKPGKPLILGIIMDSEVQDFIRTQRSSGAVVSRSTVIAIGKGVVMKHNKFYLKEFGGHIDLTKYWAESVCVG